VFHAAIAAVGHADRLERENSALVADKDRFDWLEDVYSITANNSTTWQNFMTLVVERGFRSAIDITRENEAARAVRKASPH
jgi:hypothetical protein